MKVNVSITFLLFSTHRYNLNSITLSDLQGDNVLAKVLLKALSCTGKGMCIVWHSLLDTSVLGSLWQCASGIFVYVYVCVTEIIFMTAVCQMTI